MSTAPGATCGRICEGIVPRRVSYLVVAALATLLCLGFIGSAAGASTDIDRAFNSCRDKSKGGSDKDAVHACKELEKVLQPGMHDVSVSMNAMSNGQHVSTTAAAKVVIFCRSELLATSTIARIYARHSSEGPTTAADGRAYAVQVVGWAMYDSKHLHDIIVTYANNPGNQAQEFVADNKSQLADDRKTVAEMEGMFPGVINASAAEMRMSRSQYDALMSNLYSVLR